jgi:hypothetical protein
MQKLAVQTQFSTAPHSPELMAAHREGHVFRADRTYLEPLLLESKANNKEC